jgi:pyruvate dehydrogenase E2 component (dihydrolipoamide acetyltransferase)
MATPVIMPKFGMAQEEGTIIHWLKQEGEHVEKGDVLLEVQTDKVDMEVEAPVSGVLRDIRYGPDATVPVTTVIAMLTSEADEARIRSGGAPAAPQSDVPAAAPAVDAAVAAPAEAPPSEARQRGDGRASPVAHRVAEASGVELASVVGSGPAGRIMRADVERAADAPEQGRVRATPAARRLAREQGIDLAEVQGSGPNARIQADDLRALAAQGQPALQPDQAQPAQAPSAPPHAAPANAAQARTAQPGARPLRGVRRTIARRVAQSWSTIPHIWLTARIDMARAEAARALLAPDVEALGAKLTPTVFVARAAAAALLRHPRLNAHLVEEQGEWLLTEWDAVHLGVAVALDEGLVVPVLHDAQTLGLAALAGQMGEQARSARAGRLAPADVEGGTFTLSSLGALPVDHFTALIFPPQVAILAVGRMQMEPVWDGTQFAPRPVLQATLSVDHRAVDGAVAGAFLAEFKRLLEAPERLLL